MWTDPVMVEAAIMGFWWVFCATLRDVILEDGVNEDCGVSVGGFKEWIEIEGSLESELKEAMTM